MTLALPRVTIYFILFYITFLGGFELAQLLLELKEKSFLGGNSNLKHFTFLNKQILGQYNVEMST